MSAIIHVKNFNWTFIWIVLNFLLIGIDTKAKPRSKTKTIKQVSVVGLTVSIETKTGRLSGLEIDGKSQRGGEHLRCCCCRNAMT